MTPGKSRERRESFWRRWAQESDSSDSWGKEKKKEVGEEKVKFVQKSDLLLGHATSAVIFDK